MSTWLKLLPIELSSIEEREFVEPETELRENDKVIGTMSDTVKQLYTLCHSLSKSASQCALDHKFCTDKTEKAELQARVGELIDKAKALDVIMWVLIKEDVKLWDGDIEKWKKTGEI